MLMLGVRCVVYTLYKVCIDTDYCTWLEFDMGAPIRARLASHGCRPRACSGRCSRLQTACRKMRADTAACQALRVCV